VNGPGYRVGIAALHAAHTGSCTLPTRAKAATERPIGLLPGGVSVT
jgi:hypothetical protein